MKAVMLPFCACLVACGQAPEEGNAASLQEDDPAAVSRDGFEAKGLLWPLTVNEGRLGCTQMARWVEVDGKRYGLNGIATEERGYAELEQIWSVNKEMMQQLKEAGATEGPTIRISVGDMISEAGAFCE